jgi:hypothetical protein
VAIVTPVASLFGFGASVGLPLLCGVAAGLASNVGNAAGAARASGPVITQFEAACAQFSASGSAGIAAMKKAVEPLAVINPAADPLIDTAAQTLVTFGTTAGPSIAPFGPTVAALGATVRWFATP